MPYDAYMKIQGADGESQAKGVENFFKLESFSWGAHNPTNVSSGGQGLTAGKVSVSSFNVMKRTDKASAALFLNCCNGKTFDSAEVQFRKATGDGGQKAFLTYKFTKLLVESVQWSGASGGNEEDTPTENVSFAFAKVDVDYKPQNGDGSLGTSVTSSWDNTKVSGGK